MTLWICLGTGFTVNAAQREDTKLLKIYDGKSIEASQIQFKAEVATPDSNRIDIYRSEKPVSQGGKLEKLDSFRVIGDFWEVLGDNLYMNYGDNFKVQCYSHDTCVEGNLTFVDTTAKAGHQYSYRLVYGDKVYDPDSGEYSIEILSNIINVKSNLQTPELYNSYSTDYKSVILSWSYIAQADGYRIYRYDNGKWSFLKKINKGNVITTPDKNVQTGKTYQYRVLAYKVINGKNIYSKFYDEKMYNNAVKEYTEFVEKLTGKKVLIGCTSRMNWGIQALGAFNDPKAYQNMDYILISHGKNSSLITDTKNPLTWRFSDNDKSVYEFIEKNVPKGKKVMVLCCETDGIRKAGKTAEEMFDRTGNRMYGIGNEVWATWAHQNEAIKICESGVRHIIGHCESAGSGIIMSRIGEGAGPANNSLSYLDTPKQIYYDLDFSKFTV